MKRMDSVGRLAILCGALLLLLPAPSRLAGQDAAGYPITDPVVVRNCARCHERDDEGRMSRISYLRKTPEGWQTSIRRMVGLHGVSLEPEEARAIVRYLADEQGLAPEELRPGLFEVERRLIDHDYEGDSGVEFTCIQCHSMGRVITQRRTREEWALLLATHRALYPLVDWQAFRSSGRGGGSGNGGGDRRHPMDVAIDHLSEVFPLETPEWSAWAATKRPPRLEGEWALAGYEPGRGALYGTMSISPDPSDPSAFRTRAVYTYAESGEQVTRTGESIVYTGYQWRGRSNPGTESELREVMFLERDGAKMTGRWFRGGYDELGPDVTLTRRTGSVVLTGVHPRAAERGATIQATLFGAGFPAGAGDASALDFGPGVRVESVAPAGDGGLTLRLAVAPDARVGPRSLYAFGAALDRALIVHDGVDRIEVRPEAGLARVGGAVHPKGHQVFDAIGWDDGPDGEPGTEDDLELGRVAATWALEEYAATFGDDDVSFVGEIRQDGTFVPALDGPNPERSGNRNNVGDVWVVATHRTEDGRQLRARAHLVVTVPLYMHWEPWREDLGRGRTAADGAP